MEWRGGTTGVRMKRRRRQMGDKVIAELWLFPRCRLAGRHRLCTVASRSTKESEAWVVLDQGSSWPAGADKQVALVTHTVTVGRGPDPACYLPR